MELMTTPALHLRVNGQSHDLTFADVDLSPDATDTQILTASARHLNLTSDALRGTYVVAREADTVIVRPVAVYG
jgi:hypothetical protein